MPASPQPPSKYTCVACTRHQNSRLMAIGWGESLPAIATATQLTACLPTDQTMCLQQHTQSLVPCHRMHLNASLLLLLLPMLLTATRNASLSGKKPAERSFYPALTLAVDRHSRQPIFGSGALFVLLPSMP